MQSGRKKNKKRNHKKEKEQKKKIINNQIILEEDEFYHLGLAKEAMQYLIGEEKKPGNIQVMREFVDNLEKLLLASQDKRKKIICYFSLGSYFLDPDIKMIIVSNGNQFAYEKAKDYFYLAEKVLLELENDANQKKTEESEKENAFFKKCIEQGKLSYEITITCLSNFKLTFINKQRKMSKQQTDISFICVDELNNRVNIDSQSHIDSAMEEDIFKMQTDQEYANSLIEKLIKWHNIKLPVHGKWPWKEDFKQAVTYLSLEGDLILPFAAETFLNSLPSFFQIATEKLAVIFTKHYSSENIDKYCQNIHSIQKLEKFFLGYINYLSDYIYLINEMEKISSENNEENDDSVVERKRSVSDYSSKKTEAENTLRKIKQLKTKKMVEQSKKLNQIMSEIKPIKENKIQEEVNADSLYLDGCYLQAAKAYRSFLPSEDVTLAKSLDQIATVINIADCYIGNAKLCLQQNEKNLANSFRKKSKDLYLSAEEKIKEKLKDLKEEEPEYQEWNKYLTYTKSALLSLSEKKKYIEYVDDNQEKIPPQETLIEEILIETKEVDQESKQTVLDEDNTQPERYLDIQLSDWVWTIVQKFINADVAVFLAGGPVRDALLHKQLKDIDLVVDASIEKIQKILGAEINELTGLSRPVFKLSNGYEDIDISPICAPYDPKKEKIFVVTNTGGTTYIPGTIETDVQLRDITINGLFCNLKTMKIEDPTRRGLKDLDDERIHMINSNPGTSFRDDPIRILRCIRHAIKCFAIDKKGEIKENFGIDIETTKGIYRNVSHLKNINPKRCMNEILSFIKDGNLDIALEAMHKLGVLEYIFPIANNLYDAMKSNESRGNLFIKKSFHLIKEICLTINDQNPRSENSLPLFLASMLWHPISEMIKDSNSYQEKIIPEMESTLDECSKILYLSKNLREAILLIWRSAVSRKLGVRDPFVENGEHAIDEIISIQYFYQSINKNDDFLLKIEKKLSIFSPKEIGTSFSFGPNEKNQAKIGNKK